MESFTGYTKTITADEAAGFFAAKHGYPPAVIEDGGTVWLAGPIQEQQAAHVGDNGGGASRGGGLMRRAAEAQRPMTAGEARQLALSFGGEV